MTTGLTYTVIDCGGPPQGQKWSLTQMSVAPADPFATPIIGMQAMVLRTVGNYASSNTEAPAFLGVIAPPAPIPNSLALAPGTVSFGLKEHLVVVIQNAPAGLTVLVDFEVRQSAGSYERPGARRRWWETLGRLG